MRLTLDRMNLLRFFTIGAGVSLLAAWLWFTPPGLLGKADAIAYAVCHRIANRSFFLDDRQLPLCARCTGMYLGAMTGLLYQSRLGRNGGLPPIRIAIPLGILAVLFAIDGVNSYIHFFPNLPSLYTPHNWLRLATGTGLGIGISALLFPVFNQTLFPDWTTAPLLSSFRQFIPLAVTAAIVSASILSGNPLILYPLALLASITVLVVLGMVYSMVWIMIFKKENCFHSLRSAWLPMAAGFTTALAQIALMDELRFLWTHSWEGFKL